MRTPTGLRTAESDDETFAARALGSLFAAGGVLAIVVVALPHSRAMEQTGVLIVALAACVTAALLFRGAGRLAGAALGSFLVFGTILITLAASLSPRGSAPFELFYVWVGLYAFYFFSLRVALAQTAFTGVGCAAALLLSDWPASPVSSWLLTTGTTVVAGGLVGRLVAQVRAQANDVRTVTRISRDLGRGGAPSDTREAICEAARDLAGAAASVLLEPDRELRFLVSAATGEGGAPTRCALSERSAVITAFGSGLPLFVSDLSSDPCLDALLGDGTARRSALCQPVVRDGISVGVLIVVWSGRAKRVPHRVASVVALLAAEAAAAIERGDLLARLAGARLPGSSWNLTAIPPGW